MDFGRSVELIVIMFVVLLICAVVHGARGFFDLSDLEDPLSVFWNHKSKTAFPVIGVVSHRKIFRHAATRQSCDMRRKFKGWLGRTGPM